MILVAGGLDPSGRAGLIVDCLTADALGAAPLAVATALTAQGRRPLVTAVDARTLDRQLEAVAPRVLAIKLGVIPDRAVLNVLAKWVDQLGVPTVVDPVRVSSRGVRLSSLGPADYRRLAFDHVVITPNVVEWTALRAVHGFGAWVLKSVGPGQDAVILPGKLPIYLRGKPLPRSRAAHRGTGCRFATAMAVELALGHSVLDAARAARRFVRKFLSAPIIEQV